MSYYDLHYFFQNLRGRQTVKIEYRIMTALLIMAFHQLKWFQGCEHGISCTTYITLLKNPTIRFESRVRLKVHCFIRIYLINIKFESRVRLTLLYLEFIYYSLRGFE